MRDALAWLRLLPLLLLLLSASLYVFHVEDGAYAWRNVLPYGLLLLLAGWALSRGRGRWRDAGWRWLCGMAGYAIPALGLSLYLHWGYATDLDGMYSDAVYPQELFRFLPAYTLVAGGIGFAIGWIIGRNLDAV